MLNLESKQIEDVKPKDKKNEEQSPPDIMKSLRDALDKKDSLHKVGEALLVSFQSEEYTPEIVLSSIKEVYDEYKTKFDPELGFEKFVNSFGDGMVKLCQLKLVAAGGNLGEFGENKDGVDSIFGKQTKNAFDLYYQNIGGPAQKSQNPIVQQPTKSQPEQAETTDDLEYHLGNEKAVFSSVEKLRPQIKDYYRQNKTVYSVENMAKYFGKNEKLVRRYITKIDPVTGGPISFLGKPLQGGINIKMIPFLKIAEKEIEKSQVHYVPKSKIIGGFEYREMNLINGKKGHGIMSGHAYGCCIDIDASENFPKNGRGDIPDQVVLAMAKSGLACGLCGDEGFKELGRDPMHFQMRFPPESEDGQAIINSHPIGIQYWKAIQSIEEV